MFRKFLKQLHDIEPTRNGKLLIESALQAYDALNNADRWGKLPNTNNAFEKCDRACQELQRRNEIDQDWTSMDDVQIHQYVDPTPGAEKVIGSSKKEQEDAMWKEHNKDLNLPEFDDDDLDADQTWEEEETENTTWEIPYSDEEEEDWRSMDDIHLEDRDRTKDENDMWSEHKETDPYVVDPWKKDIEVAHDWNNHED